MTKHELGQKHFCTNCGAKFYDLTRSPPTCPKCETVVEVVEKPRPTRAAAKPKPKPPAPKPAAEADDALLETAVDADDSADDDDEAGDAVIEDVSELGEDEDDVAGVVSGEDDTT